MWTGLTELAAAEGREAQTAQEKLLDIAGANEELRDVAAEAKRERRFTFVYKYTWWYITVLSSYISIRGDI